MSRVRVAAFSVSLDGFSAGPRQDLQSPLGVRGPEIFAWFFQTDVFRKMHGQADGARGVDSDFALRSFENVGAFILGRNMFGPVRGPWPTTSWKGWWGDTPPYHTPVFVLTHHARTPLVVNGGTTFHFVTDGIESALRQARMRRGERCSHRRRRVGDPSVPDVAGHIDEMHLALSPALLGEGEHLFSGINLHALGMAVERSVAGENATHVVIKKR
mgnify:CR=1 FL=1